MTSSWFLIPHWTTMHGQPRIKPLKGYLQGVYLIHSSNKFNKMSKIQLSVVAFFIFYKNNSCLIFIVNRSSETTHARSASNICAADLLVLQLKLQCVCKCVSVFTHLLCSGPFWGHWVNCLEDCLMMALVTCRNMKQTYWRVHILVHVQLAV